MATLQGLRIALTMLATASLLAACGGGSDNSPAATPAPVTSAPNVVGAPLATGNIATDAVNWVNFRRTQIGMPQVARVALIDVAAERHSSYQQQNQVTHDQIPGRPGFTGATLADRLQQVNYLQPNYFIGEVISASNSSSGAYLTEELITAIYHRFVIFEPKFKEIGAGSVTAGSGYTILTINFASINGYGPGIGRTNLVTWPASGQTGVAPNFLSDFESPDPVANQNEVGYPISVHADADVLVAVTSFTVKPRGGANLATKLLRYVADRSAPDYDEYMPQSAASIIPLSVLAPNTVYDVSFAGAIGGLPVTKSWSFTTKP